MGNWNITIQGVGCHHNRQPEIDANHTAEECVRTLLKQGHIVTAATFTSGGADDLLQNVRYKDSQPATDQAGPPAP